MIEHPEPGPGAVSDDPSSVPKVVPAPLHLLPKDADLKPVTLSIVIPALNEALTIGEFVRWCHQGIAAAGVPGQILIVDSSTDETPRIALREGAEVLQVPKRGLGQAYIDAIPYVRGKFIIMGDCDLTYEFRDLSRFMEKFNAGYEFVMGTRMKGYIEPHAMPPLHRYLGTPVTTWMLNTIYGTRFSDIHCGMRGVTLDGFCRMKIRSRLWEYASEMIIKSVHLRLRTTEVPIRFYKDREGRLSHLKRGGWLTPWFAAWITMRAMFVYGADFFLFLPGLLMLLAGLSIVAATSFGPVVIGPVGLSLYWMLAGMCAAIVGLHCVYMGILARLFYGGKIQTEKVVRLFRYNRSVLCSAGLFLLGIVLTLPLVRDYVRYHLALPHGIQPKYYLAVTGLLMIIAAFANFTFTLVVHAFAAIREDLS
jgi:glycosyltransferase involved in cell wall biosynthesis